MVLIILLHLVIEPINLLLFCKRDLNTVAFSLSLRIWLCVPITQSLRPKYSTICQPCLIYCLPGQIIPQMSEHDRCTWFHFL
jgi:hypothetical protein